MKMPFGKYGPTVSNPDGTELSEIPTGYLEWLIVQKKISASLLIAANEELNLRRWVSENPEKGRTTRLSEQVFMGELGALLIKCPEKFLTEKWYITVEGIGRFEFERMN